MPRLEPNVSMSLTQVNYYFPYWFVFLLYNLQKIILNLGYIYLHLITIPPHCSKNRFMELFKKSYWQSYNVSFKVTLNISILFCSDLQLFKGIVAAYISWYRRDKITRKKYNKPNVTLRLTWCKKKYVLSLHKI